MQVWYHCENVSPFVPKEVLDAAESVRASLPNKYCDPKIAADLFEECLDEHLLCDDLGINVVSIEHHSGINSLYGASTMIMGIMARQTKKVRVLSLGTLISVRPDPVRIAEEYATADVISREGPVSFEGKYFTHRHINIWPPPYQRPHPQFWAATGDPETSAECGRR